MAARSVQDAFLWQSQTCEGMGAPLCAKVLRLIVEAQDVSEAFDPFLTALDGRSIRGLVTEAHPLRALGALHFIVLSGLSPDLAACYADFGGAGLAAAITGAVRDHSDIVASFMASPPQTNEVRRALCLVGGFLIVAAESGLPLRCLEIGASAGINLNWDRFGYEFGEHGRWGSATSPVQLVSEWTGGAPPLDADVKVVLRAACDQRPVDIADEAAALRLLAYVWPDQPERMARARAAIALTRRAQTRVEAADAGPWTQRRAHPQQGVATVLYHSVFWQYPPSETRAAILQTIGRAGSAASRDAPFAWLRMEPSVTDPAQIEVRLTLWPGGEERLLAHVHPHGATVKWLNATEQTA